MKAGILLSIAAVLLMAGCAFADADNGNGTISSYLGYFWLKDAGCLGKTDWNSAIARVGALQSGSCGLSDNSKAGQWRLPSRIDLLYRVSHKELFTNVQVDCYWSGESYSAEAAWYVTKEGNSGFGPKSTMSCYMWPLRQ